MTDKDVLRNRRLKHNELLFREINEARQEAAPDGASVVLNLLCECSDPTCAERIKLDSGSYDAIRTQPNRYIVLPGHEDARVERVVEERPQFEIVEKEAA